MPAWNRGITFSAAIPGTGKSTIAVKFAQILGALRLTGRFEPTRVTGTMFVQALEREGVAGMRRIIDKARGGVLFIDEAHQLLSIPGALQLLLDPMIELRSELCVILACYDDQAEALFSAEPGPAQRLSAVFYFADYTAEELTQIFVGETDPRRATGWADGGREAALAMDEPPSAHRQCFPQRPLRRDAAGSGAGADG